MVAFNKMTNTDHSKQLQQLCITRRVARQSGSKAFRDAQESTMKSYKLVFHSYIQFCSSKRNTIVML